LRSLTLEKKLRVIELFFQNIFQTNVGGFSFYFLIPFSLTTVNPTMYMEVCRKRDPLPPTSVEFSFVERHVLPFFPHRKIYDRPHLLSPQQWSVEPVVKQWRWEWRSNPLSHSIGQRFPTNKGKCGQNNKLDHCKSHTQIICITSIINFHMIFIALLVARRHKVFYVCLFCGVF